MKKIVEVKNLSYAYVEGNLALDDVSFSLEEGSITASSAIMARVSPRLPNALWVFNRISKARFSFSIPN